jgi:hypothetical protein
MQVSSGVRNPERSFGISVGAVLLAIGAALVWRGRIRAAEVTGSIGAVLLLLGLVKPSLLEWPSKAWWAFALTLGYVNARVILSVAFYLVLTPLALVWRLIGKDPLAFDKRHWPGWTPYPARYKDPDHFTRMY